MDKRKLMEIRKYFPCFGHYHYLSCLQILPTYFGPLHGKCPYEALCKKLTYKYVFSDDYQPYADGQIDKPREDLKNVFEGKVKKLDKEQKEIEIQQRKKALYKELIITKNKIKTYEMKKKALENLDKPEYAYSQTVNIILNKMRKKYEKLKKEYDKL